MRKMGRLRVFITSLVLLLSLSAFSQRKVCIDSDWKFHYGDGSAALTDIGVASEWRTLTLPHDRSVECEAAQAAGGQVVGPFSTNSTGKFQTGFTVGGEGWYMRRLPLLKSDLSGCVLLYFEGAYNHSWVYVNGRLCHENVYGYSSFRVDVTDLAYVRSNGKAGPVILEAELTACCN